MRACRLSIFNITIVCLMASLAYVRPTLGTDDLDDWNPLPDEGPASFVIIPILFPQDEGLSQVTIWEQLPGYIPGGPLDGSSDENGDAIEVNPHRTPMTQAEFELMCESRPGSSFEVAVDGRWVCCKVDWGCFICNESMDCEIDCASVECELEFGSDYEGPHFDNPAAADACQKDGDGDGYPDGIYSEFDDGGWGCCDPDYGCLECHPGSGCEMMCFTPECQATMNGTALDDTANAESSSGPGKRYRRATHSRSRQ